MIYIHLCLQIYTKITEVKLSAFVYRLFHEGFSQIIGKILLYVHNALHWALFRVWL